MLNFQNLSLLHRHGDDEVSPMTEHTAETHDPERSILRGELRGARIFRCEVCADEVLVMTPGNSDAEDAAAAQ